MILTKPVRLFEFILEHTEEIVLEWEQFARSTTPGTDMDKLSLRDDVHAILMAISADMQNVQTPQQQSAKSRGETDCYKQNRFIGVASQRHGRERLMSGFEINELVSEYRALRASVIRLWSHKGPLLDERAVDDMTRFNEAIDQSLAVALKTYTDQVECSHQLFLAILAHDLRSPLASIQSGVKLLSRKQDADQEFDPIASQMNCSISAMDHLIADMLDFARTVSGTGIPLSKSETDLKSLCEEVLEETKLAYPLLHFELQCNGTHRGDWDTARLRQVLTNLLSNAAQHGDKEQPIFVTLHDTDSHTLLIIQNKGDPISEAKLSTLFNPMCSSKPAELKENAGLGLGLYIAKEIAIAHGGDIAVESSQSDGTIFTVRLPKNNEG